MLFRSLAATSVPRIGTVNANNVAWRCRYRPSIPRILGEPSVATATQSLSSSSGGPPPEEDEADPPKSPSAPPVMQEEVLKLWFPDDKHEHDAIRLIDGTIGLGGHTLAAMNSCGRNLNLSVLGIDRDASALAKFKKLLSEYQQVTSDADSSVEKEDESDNDEAESTSTGQAVESSSLDSKSPCRLHLHHGSFAEISPDLLNRLSLDPPNVHGILLDCGGPNALAISSPDRGYSFRKQGPLDMRYDVLTPDKINDATRARNIVNHWSYFEMASLFRSYSSDDLYPNDIAAAIVEWRLSEKVRPKHAKRGPKGIRSTLELRYIIEEAVEVVARRQENNWKQRQNFRQLKAIWRPPKKPAKMNRKQKLIRKFEERKPRYLKHIEGVFRALRMEVNKELEHIGMIFRNKIAEQCLELGGRLVVMTYHPIEDGLVRKGMEEMVASGEFRMLTPKEEGLRPLEEEVEANELSREARLRAVERVR